MRPHESPATAHGGTTATLTRLRHTVRRRTPNAMRGFGALLGALAAGWTIGIGLGWWADPANSAALLAGVFLVWLLGWLFGPMQSGRGDLIDPRWFATLPLNVRRLAPQLVAAGCTGTGAVVTFTAALGLAALGARAGAGPALIGLVAAVPLTVLMVTTARLVGEALRAGARNRLATELLAAQWGLFIASLTVGWFVIWPLFAEASAFGGRIAVPDGVATILRVLPSGWGVVAVEAAGQGRWLWSLAVLAALVALTAGAISLWGVLLQRRLTEGPTAALGGTRRSAGTWLPRTPLGAVIYRDLRTWWRDPRRGIEVRSALWAGVFATAGLWVALPEVAAFAGVFIAIIGAMACVNVYAMDGTALWHSLVSPGALAVDVRGRQVAWLMVFVPASALASAVGLVVTQAWWALPWVLALLLALLGGAAGLIPLLSVVGLAPETDAHRRSGNPAETGADATGLYFLMLAATLLAAVPVGACLAFAVVRQNQSYAWLAVAVGAVTGLGLAWALGRVTRRRLEARAPELLQLMRTGTPAGRDASANTDAGAGWHSGASWQLGVLWTLAMISLVPQGALPMVFLATGADAHSWFVALYLPVPWSYLAAAGFVVLGLAFAFLAVRIQRTLAARAESDQTRGTAPHPGPGGH